MQFINIDPIPVNTPAIELYRDGQLLTDFYNGCSLNEFTFNGDSVTLRLEVVHDAGKQGIGTSFSVTFSNVQILDIKLEGKTLDDLGQLTEVTILDENEGKLQLSIASSIWIVLQCNSLAVNGI